MYVCVCVDTCVLCRNCSKQNLDLVCNSQSPTQQHQCEGLVSHLISFWLSASVPVSGPQLQIGAKGGSPCTVGGAAAPHMVTLMVGHILSVGLFSYVFNWSYCSSWSPFNCSPARTHGLFMIWHLWFGKCLLLIDQTRPPFLIFQDKCPMQMCSFFFGKKTRHLCFCLVDL